MNQQQQQEDLWKAGTPSGHAAYSKSAPQDDGLHFASCRNPVAVLAPLENGPFSPHKHSPYKKSRGHLSVGSTLGNTGQWKSAGFIKF